MLSRRFQSSQLSGLSVSGVWFLPKRDAVGRMGGNLPLLRWDFVWKYQMCDGEREEEAPAFLNHFCEHLLQAPSRLRVNTGYSSQSSLASLHFVQVAPAAARRFAPGDLNVSFCHQHEVLLENISAPRRAEDAVLQPRC